MDKIIGERRRGFRFRLRSLFLLTTLVSIACPWLADYLRDRKPVVVRFTGNRLISDFRLAKTIKVPVRGNPTKRQFHFRSTDIAAARDAIERYYAQHGLRAEVKTTRHTYDDYDCIAFVIIEKRAAPSPAPGDSISLRAKPTGSGNLDRAQKKRTQPSDGSGRSRRQATLAAAG